MSIPPRLGPSGRFVEFGSGEIDAWIQTALEEVVALSQANLGDLLGVGRNASSAYPVGSASS